MIDRENVIKGLHDIGGFIAGQIGIAQARNFLRTIDDTIELLKEQEAEISFLKGMQLQTVHNMSDEDIGNAVAQVIGLKGI